MSEKKIFYVYNFSHPASNAGLVVDEVVYARQTVNTIRKRYGNGRDILIFVNGKEILSKDQKKTRIKIGDKVELYPAVGFLGALFSAIAGLFTWEMVGTIVLSMALSYLG